jgi:uncharacterized protein with von Willebrand factor type A (vWA) domain
MLETLTGHAITKKSLLEQQVEQLRRTIMQLQQERLQVKRRGRRLFQGYGIHSQCFGNRTHWSERRVERPVAAKGGARIDLQNSMAMPTDS